MEWIEVADSAIKIGLGAAIAGVSAFLLLRRTQAGEFQKELRQRRWKILEEVAESVQEAYREHIDHIHALSELRALNDETPSNDRERIKTAVESFGTSLIDQMQSLSTAEAKLLLLGEQDAHRICRYCHDSMTTHLASKTDALAGTTFDDPCFAHDPEKWRKDFFQCLSEIYRRM